MYSSTRKKLSPSERWFQVNRRAFVNNSKSSTPKKCRAPLTSLSKRETQLLQNRWRSNSARLQPKSLRTSSPTLRFGSNPPLWRPTLASSRPLSKRENKTQKPTNSFSTSEEKAPCPLLNSKNRKSSSTNQLPSFNSLKQESIRRRCCQSSWRTRARYQLQWNGTWTETRASDSATKTAIHLLPRRTRRST